MKNVKNLIYKKMATKTGIDQFNVQCSASDTGMMGLGLQAQANTINRINALMLVQKGMIIGKTAEINSEMFTDIIQKKQGAYIKEIVNFTNEDLDPNISVDESSGEMTLMGEKLYHYKMNIKDRGKTAWAKLRKLNKEYNKYDCIIIDSDDKIWLTQSPNGLKGFDICFFNIGKFTPSDGKNENYHPLEIQFSSIKEFDISGTICSCESGFSSVSFDDCNDINFKLISSTKNGSVTFTAFLDNDRSTGVNSLSEDNLCAIIGGKPTKLDAADIDLNIDTSTYTVTKTGIEGIKTYDFDKKTNRINVLGIIYESNALMTA